MIRLLRSFPIVPINPKINNNATHIIATAKKDSDRQSTSFRHIVYHGTNMPNGFISFRLVHQFNLASNWINV